MMQPFHKTKLYMELTAAQEDEYSACNGDPLEVARVTGRYGRLIQSAYMDYQTRATVAVLNEYQRRALEDGASYGN